MSGRSERDGPEREAEKEIEQGTGAQSAHDEESGKGLIEVQEDSNITGKE